MSSIEARLHELNLKRGDNYTLSAYDIQELLRALNWYRETIERIGPNEARAQRLRDLHDIIDMGFETVVKGVGE